MKLSNSKTLAVACMLAAGIIVSVAATKPATLKIKSVINNSDTGYFKNLQILPKDISKDSLDKIMHSYTKALGVHCNFCHAGANGKLDFASDEKEEKGIARYMMKMTADINKQYFNFEKSTMPDTINVIKCITCHRGSPHPDEAGMGNMEEHHHDMPPGSPPQNGQMPPPPMDSSKHN